MSPATEVRAARLHAHGEPLAIDTVELPSEPAEGEVRVELEYGGVNPIDRYIAVGRVAPDGPLPRVLGGEAAGRYEGRPVLVAGAGLGAVRDGVWRAVADVPEETVVDVPDGVGLAEAAAMGIAGLTAWNCVHQLAGVTSEDRVLVLGASGGVGSMIVSLVNAVGGTVWGQTGSEDKRDHITASGAERAVVADPDSLVRTVRQLAPTVVFDPLGGGFLDAVVEAVEPHGRIVTFGTSASAQVTFNLQNLYRKGITLYGYAGMLLTREERRDGLRAALEALARGDLRVSIDEALPLADVNEALARLEQRRVRGKLLLALGS